MTDFEPPNPDYARFVTQVVTSMPAARFLGLEFGELTPGTAELILPVRAELTQHDGYVQGGTRHARGLRRG